MSRPFSSESVFRAIAHTTRRNILNLLRNSEKRASDLLTTPGLTKPTLSTHLQILKSSGLITVRRRGTSLLYRINRNAMKPLLDWTESFRTTR
jgi:DNA-binding transcriptional ArsR family regulator